MSWCTALSSGGFGLVAVARAVGVSEKVVAECGYEALPNGNGELGITVAPGWRGWLGPYLLDVLLDAAAARGVPNLEADILVENRPMLAMISARGYATVDHYEQPSIVRVVIGAQDRSPCWPEARDRPRVLIEAPGGRWHGEGAARAAGLEVLVCPGPLRARARCPALIGEVCPLAAGADVIVDAVSLEEEAGRALLASHRRLHRAVPVCVEQPPEAPEIHGVSRIPLGAGETVVVGLLQRFAGALVTDEPHPER